jgi:DNA end-binding protein Ku
VPSEEIIRGYEIGPDKYLLVTDEELESLSPERTRTIEITEFIDLQEVHPIYYDHPYYLIPSKGGEKSYRLLAEVMARTNKAGLARFVLHEREYLVAVQSTGAALTLITLHYPEEILAADEVAPPADAADKDRLKNVISNMLADFDPQHYADTSRQKILDLLQQKAKDQALVEAPAAAQDEGEGPADLIAALEESMRQIKKQP